VDLPGLLQAAVRQPLVATYADVVQCSRLEDVEYLTFFQPTLPAVEGARTPLMPVAQIVLTNRTAEKLARILSEHSGLEIADSKDASKETL